MSAWLVSKKHIDVLVHARSISKFWDVPENEMTDTELGKMLWRENMLSLEARYDDRIDDDLLEGYSYSEPKQFPIVNILKAIHCYEYQSCEHEGWKNSAAHNYCKLIHHALISYLPGYDDAPWGID